jgi:hypothetical protein
MKKGFIVLIAASVALLIFFVPRIYEVAGMFGYNDSGVIPGFGAYSGINRMGAVFALSGGITALLRRTRDTFIAAYVPALLIAISLTLALLSLCTVPRWEYYNKRPPTVHSDIVENIGDVRNRAKGGA